MPIRIDSDTGLRIFDTRAASTIDAVAGSGESEQNWATGEGVWRRGHPPSAGSQEAQRAVPVGGGAAQSPAAGGRQHGV